MPLGNVNCIQFYAYVTNASQMYFIHVSSDANTGFVEEKFNFLLLFNLISA